MKAKRAARPSPVAIERIDKTEQEYLAGVVGRLRAAQMVVDDYAQHLTVKHRLAQGDHINYQTGVITRKAKG